MWPCVARLRRCFARCVSGTATGGIILTSKVNKTKNDGKLIRVSLSLCLSLRFCCSLPEEITRNNKTRRHQGQNLARTRTGVFFCNIVTLMRWSVFGDPCKKMPPRALYFWLSMRWMAKWNCLWLPAFRPKKQLDTRLVFLIWCCCCSLRRTHTQHNATFLGKHVVRLIILECLQHK